MDSFDETYSHTGYEPKAYDFKETSVESYTELLTSPPFLSDKGFPEDAEYDDAALEGMLLEAHRLHGHHSQREDLSVSLPSSVSDRTGRLVGDRAGRPAEQSSQDAQIRLCWTDKKSEFLPSARQKSTDTNFKPLMTEEVYENWVKLLNLNKKNFTSLELKKKFNDEINSFFKDSKNLELREAHQKSLSEMEELKKFQSSTFDTIARRRLVDDQDTILELSGRIQELQNEINCMSD